MPRSTLFKLCAAMGVFTFIPVAHPADADPCTRFTWDVTRELAVMKQKPEAVTAGVKAGTDIPKLIPDRLYELKLSDQSAMSFAAKPSKPALPDGVTACVLALCMSALT